MALALLFAPSPAFAELVDRIVAVVNDSVITFSELEAATAVELGGLRGGGSRQGEDLVGTRSRVLDELIEKKLMKQAADMVGIEVSDREIENAVEDVKRDNKISGDELMLALAENGLTYNDYKEQLREQIRQVKFISRRFRSRIQVKQEDIEEYYIQNREKFYGASSYRIRLILLSGDDMGIVERRLKTVQEELENGEEFSRVASLYSDGTAAAEGGDLGYVNTGELDGAIEDAAMVLETGGISPPVRTSSGVAIVQLLDRKGREALSIEEVDRKIRNALYDRFMDDRYEIWLDEMRRLAHIEVKL